MSPEVEELQQEQRELKRRMRRILDKAETHERDLHPDEEERFDKLADELEDIEAQLRVAASTPAEPQQEVFAKRTSRNGRTTRHDLTLTREQRMADWYREHRGLGNYTADEVEQFSIGRAIRASATGDWSGAELEHRALSEGVAASGGFLTPEVLSTRFIDLVRAKARVLEAGATTVPLESDEHSLPRLATGGTAAWRNENTAVFESEGTFDRVTFRPKTLARSCLLSFELAEDMLPGSAQRIDAEIADSLALELDRVALRGSGTAPEPRGIRNTTGVEVQSATFGANGGTPGNHDFLVRAVTGVRRDNFDANAILYSTRTEETLALLKDTTNQPLTRPRILDNVSELATNQIPDNLTTGTSTDTSEAYAAQWDELLIGVRPTIGVRFVRETVGQTLQYRITAYLRADIQLAHPAAFAVVPGIRP